MGAHLPVLALQAFLRQVVSAPALPVTAVAGFSWQALACTLQNSVPLQRLPSSCLAQSASLLQPQVHVPAGHLPALQTSPAVHVSPSSHAMGADLSPGASSFHAQTPSLSQAFFSFSVIVGLHAPVPG